MKGAVLHKLGLNFVKERIMRRSYGIDMSRPWEDDDPIANKGISYAGETICCDVMRWYTTKVP